MKSLDFALLEQALSALWNKHEDSVEHLYRVADLCQQFARALGVSEHEERRLQLAGMLHDIGKVHVRVEILSKPAPLDAREWLELRLHADQGSQLVEQLTELEGFALIADLIRFHHERWDGGGYPLGLRATEIPFGARVIAIVDAYDAMTSDRPYRQALGHEKAVCELREHRGSQFDPALVDAFLQWIEQAQIQTLVNVNGSKPRLPNAP